jgi:hypothetical protein
LDVAKWCAVTVKNTAVMLFCKGCPSASRELWQASGEIASPPPPPPTAPHPTLISAKTATSPKITSTGSGGTPQSKGCISHPMDRSLSLPSSGGLATLTLCISLGRRALQPRARSGPPYGSCATISPPTRALREGHKDANHSFVVGAHTPPLRPFPREDSDRRLRNRPCRRTDKHFAV